MTSRVDQDVIGFDVSVKKEKGGKSRQREEERRRPARRDARRDEPMDESQLVNCLDREDALRHVELGHVLRESVVLDQPGQEKNIVSFEEREGGRKGRETHIVIRSPPGKNSIKRYRKLGSWNE